MLSGFRDGRVGRPLLRELWQGRTRRQERGSVVAVVYRMELGTGEGTFGGPLSTHAVLQLGCLMSLAN